MRAIIVDDEPLISEHIRRLLVNAGIEVLGCFTNPVEVLEEMDRLKPDVLFLDIEMPEMSGLELAEKVFARDRGTEIVFITAYNQYALEAFRVNALDYLLKPVMPEDLMQTVERVRKRLIVPTAKHSYQKNSKLRVFLFGSVSVYVGEQHTPIHWITAKCAETFAFMLLHAGDKEISKWKLIEALWAEKNLEKADINLRSTISRLNKTLREYRTGITVASTGNGYRLEAPDVDLVVDAYQLEQYAIESMEIGLENVVQIEEILTHYDQMLLEDFSGEWCVPLRERFHGYFTYLAKKMISFYENNAVDLFKSLNLVELLIQNEPYEDRFRAMALKLHYQISGKKRVSDYYDAYVHLLELELNTEPSEELKGLYQSLVVFNE